jgi:iron(III) transport system permease protein
LDFAIAFVTRYIPYGIRYTHSGLLQLHRELEEGLMLRGFVVECDAAHHDAIAPSSGGWVLSSALGKELSMSILLVSPQTPVVSVAIYELWENGQVGELAAFGVIWTTILVSIAVAYYLFARRYGIQQH